MKTAPWILAIAALACAGSPTHAAVLAAGASPANLKCETGPLHKSYGRTEWLVYACDDSRSVVIVSAPGSPAMPFYFMLHVNSEGKLAVHGEGTGAKTATKAAFDDIQRLTVADVAALVSQARGAR